MAGPCSSLPGVSGTAQGLDVPRAPATVRGDPNAEMTVVCCLGLLERAEVELETTYLAIADRHSNHSEVSPACQRFAADCTQHSRELEAFIDWYRDRAGNQPQSAQFPRHHHSRRGGLPNLTWDLICASMIAAECEMAWTLAGQAGQALGDRELVAVARRCRAEMATQLDWLKARLGEGSIERGPDRTQVGRG